MLDINGKDISISRGDTYVIDFSAIDKQTGEDHEFSAGDIIFFRIISVSGYDKIVLKEKQIEVTEQTTIVHIPIIVTDTTDLCEEINSPVEFWYEISVNDTQTIIGYDEEDGASRFIVLPAVV